MFSLYLCTVDKIYSLNFTVRVNAAYRLNCQTSGLHPEHLFIENECIWRMTSPALRNRWNSMVVREDDLLPFYFSANNTNSRDNNNNNNNPFLPSCLLNSNYTIIPERWGCGVVAPIRRLVYANISSLGPIVAVAQPKCLSSQHFGIFLICTDSMFSCRCRGKFHDDYRRIKNRGNQTIKNLAL